MNKTIINSLSTLILVSGVWTFVLPQEKIKIAVIPKSNNAIFWKSVHAGVKLGAAALGGVEIVWRGPSKEDDVAEQISIVEQFINEGVSGIVLAPLDRDALAVPVAHAAKGRIPVLIYDSVLRGKQGKDFISYIGIDNKKAGNVAGQQLAKLLGGKGKVVMLRCAISQSNLRSREEGFLEAIAKYEGIQVIEKNRHVSGTTEEAMNESMKMADKLAEADGIFCSFEQSTMGMVLALRKLNLAGKVKFVGFDAPAFTIEALKKNEIDAVVTQDPARMGYFCIKTIVDKIRGKEVPSNIDVDVCVITRDNLNDPDIQKLIALPSMSD